MEGQILENKLNGVNGSEFTNDATASLGSACYAQQVALGRHQATASKSKDKQNIYKILTWNVRTLYQGGKPANVENEMERLKIDIMGIGEMRWPGSGEMTTEKNRKVIYSGGDTANRGVGIIMENDIYKKLIGYWPISERIIMMKLQGKPFNINIIQVYVPTEDSTEEELEDFYEELTRIREQCKNHDVNIVMGDMNAKVGNGRHEDIVGQYGLGEKNTRGQKIDRLVYTTSASYNKYMVSASSKKIVDMEKPQATGTEIKLTISPSIEDSGMPYIKQKHTRVQIAIVITTYW